MNKKMKIVVIGGTGLIGTKLVNILKSTFLPEHLKNNQVAYQKVALTFNL